LTSVGLPFAVVQNVGDPRVENGRMPRVGICRREPLFDEGRTSWAWMLVESDGRETKCTVRLAESIREHVGTTGRTIIAAVLGMTTAGMRLPET
jgi:hypothetical protein